MPKTEETEAATGRALGMQATGFVALPSLSPFQLSRDVLPTLSLAVETLRRQAQTEAVEAKFLRDRRINDLARAQERLQHAERGLAAAEALSSQMDEAHATDRATCANQAEG